MSNNNGGGSSKRKADGCTGTPVSQIKRTGTGGSGDAIVNLPPTTKSVTLTKNGMYFLNCLDYGGFQIQGGSAGTFYLDGTKVAIHNSQDSIIFSEGGQKDRVSIKDESGTTTVSLIPGGAGMKKKYFPAASFSNVNISGDAVHTFQIASYESGQIEITNGRANISLASQESIPIRAFPNSNKVIVLRGNRNFVISGSGAYLLTSGCGDVTVNGDLEQASQVLTGNLTVHGNVSGSVNQSGTGVMRINGEIKGCLTQSGTGNIEVHGNTGIIYQKGAGSIDVYCDHLGPYVNLGLGTLHFHADADKTSE